MKLVSVVGARPQFVKLGPVAHACARQGGIEHIIVHTGQHYDAGMSDVFFETLGIPAPHHNLGVGSGSHGAQTGAMLAALETVFEQERPDWVLVYGDTNSTVAAALAAVKMHMKVAHLEAGLRSFNRRMPEEHNRVLTDHASDVLLAPTEVAMEHLRTEGLGARSVLVGDVMTDVCLATQRTAGAPVLPHGVDSDYVVATVHRPDNTDEAARLRTVIDALAGLPVPVVLVAHPRLVAAARTHGLSLTSGSLRPIDPVGYPEMVSLVQHAAGVVTDSGGLQKEAYLIGTPCTTIRPETEWVETLEHGWNVLCNDVVGLDALAVRPHPETPRGTPYGDGHAADRTASALVQLHQGTPIGEVTFAATP